MYAHSTGSRNIRDPTHEILLSPSRNSIDDTAIILVVVVVVVAAVAVGEAEESVFTSKEPEIREGASTRRLLADGRIAVKCACFLFFCECVGVCVCVCVCGREREEREKVSVYVCVSVCVSQCC